MIVRERRVSRNGVRNESPKLLNEALRLSGATSKREVVEDSLRLFIQVKRQERIRKARGKLKWTGDLEAVRRDR